MSYYIVRMGFNRKPRRVRGKSGLTLEQAQAHCQCGYTHARGVCQDCHRRETIRRVRGGVMPRCENSSYRHIIAPGCMGYRATKEVTVIYGVMPFSGKMDCDVLLLCNRCATNLTRDAESHGYEVAQRRI